MKSGFGNTKGIAPTLNPRAKPLKRPSQARAIFTVEAIYEAFVRIWQRDGWSGLTTRAVALEAGVAIGTLYDYFPSKEAIDAWLITAWGGRRYCITAQPAAAQTAAWLLEIESMICGRLRG